MLCPKCGAAEQKAGAPCSLCGEVISNAPPPPPPPQHMRPSYPTARQPVQVKTYLIQSILVTVLCCLPLGVAGIVYASRAASKAELGDTLGAELEADNAKKMCIWGLIGGIIIIIVSIVAEIAKQASGVSPTPEP